MDSFSLTAVLKILSDFGMVGLVIFMWWSDNKRMWATLARYEKDMQEQREMYKSNVSLCRDFAGIATDLRDIVSLNIQTMTRVDDGIRQNQYCPMVRIDRVKKMTIPEKDNG
jgi:hypothetical protein